MKKILLTILILSGFAAGVSAQYNPADKLPQDAKVRTGKLENGLTYYVRHNEEPKERASFYIIQNVGAILENDDQNGLAHFLEHMAFNGTKHFPGRKGITDMLEKRGVMFGRDVNAYTSQDETVYNISNVPTKDVGLLDTCLLVLYDWSHNLTLDDKEIDNERPIITEEWRTRNGPGARMFKEMAPVLYNGAKYAYRDVIGDVEVINNFEYDVLRAYYRKWYRPDLQAIAVVGDFDAEEMERKIIELFSTIPPKENPAPRLEEEIPYKEGISYVSVTDPELTTSSIALYMKYKSTPREIRGTYGDMRQGITQSLYNSMIGQRFAEIVRRPDAPFRNASVGFMGFVRNYDIFAVSTTARPGAETEAFEGALTELERVRRYGFTQGELDRAKAQYMSSIENSYQRRDKRSSESFIESMKEGFLNGEAISDISDSYQIIKQMLPGITLEEVSALTDRFATYDNSTVIVQGPTVRENPLTEAGAFAAIQKIRTSEPTPYVDSAAGSELMSGEVKGGSIVSERTIPEIGATEWTLSNGAKVVFHYSEHDKNSVTLSSYSKGGVSLYGLDLLPSASQAGNFTGSFGLGEHDPIALGKLLAGKRVGVQASIDSSSEAVSGSSTPEDLETMFQMVYMTFEQPRFDQEIFQVLMRRNYESLVNAHNDPNRMMSDSLRMISSGYSPRVNIINEEYLDQIKLDEIEKVYRERISNASDFIFFISGEIDAETVKPLVAKYIGSISSTGVSEDWNEENLVRTPKGRTERIVPIPWETPKTTVYVMFENDKIEYNPRNNTYISILKQVLDARYLKTIRESEGGTYGVGVSANSSKRPFEGYWLTMSFDSDPEKAARLKSLVYAELNDIIEIGPTAEELLPVVTGMKKNLESAKLRGGYWMGVIQSYYLNGINTDDPANNLDIINSVTPENMQEFTRKLISGSEQVDIMFTPAESEVEIQEAA